PLSINQSELSPSAFCHMMSVLPSLLKSPAATVCHPGKFGSCSVPALAPFAMSQPPSTPLPLSQITSVLPDPLKSPDAISCHVASQSATMISFAGKLTAGPLPVANPC